MTKTGFIYKLCINDSSINDFYIGSTYRLRQRKSKHKTRCYDKSKTTYSLPLYECIRNNGGFEKWNMLELEKLEYNEKKELHQRERYWIDKLKPTLNVVIPTRTAMEYRKENKEKIHQYMSKYRREKKEKIQETHKKYLSENSEKIKKQYSQQFECEICGGHYTQAHKYRHTQSKKHQKALV